MLSLLSSLAGYCIVIGAFLISVPQIYNVISNKRVDGLSLPSLLFDLLAGMFGFTINWSLSHPFSVYGELVPILCQVSILSYLVILYSFGQYWAKLFYSSFIITFATLLLVKPFTIIWYLNLPIAIAALLGKIQQLYSIYLNKDAGVVSLSSAVLGSIGCSVRNFTILVLFLETEPENRDGVGLGISLLLCLCQAVLACQVYVYNYLQNQNKKDL